MKRRTLNRCNVAPADRFGWLRLCLLALLLAVPLCASANPFSFVPRTDLQLAEHDQDGRQGKDRKSYHERRGDQSDNRWNNPQQRRHMEDRRRRFEALPQKERQRIIETRERFLHLPPEDRERLRQRWQQMSPEDRRRWRDSESHRD
jgi:hypothetical protein